MATIYPRGERWYLNWSEGGRQHRKSLGRITEHEADLRRKAKEVELGTGKRIFIASALFDDHLERYLTWHRAEFPDSHFRVAQIAAQHFGDFRGRALAQIDSPLIERWKAARMSIVSRESVAKELRTLKAVFHKAVQWGEMDANPALHVEAPRALESEPIVWYSKPQLAKLYRMHHGITWRLLANTGLRRTEAQQLKWHQVDLRRRSLDVISSAEARTKSGRWRQVPLSDGAVAALKVLKKRAGKSDFVLPRITAESLSRAFLQDVARLNLKGSLHSLRHTYGAHLVMAGVPLRTVQVLMGHASFKTTERYAHLGKDHLREKARLVSL
jgi:site-specific recombinase XerD